jgi:hypothetical protein
MLGRCLRCETLPFEKPLATAALFALPWTGAFRGRPATLATITTAHVAAARRRRSPLQQFLELGDLVGVQEFHDLSLDALGKLGVGLRISSQLALLRLGVESDLADAVPLLVFQVETSRSAEDVL